jgi:uncharacterized membrane protein
LYNSSGIEIKESADNYYAYTQYNEDLRHFRHIWVINFSLIYLTILSLVNFFWLKSRQLGFVNILLNTICIAVFLTQGLYLLSELRESYLQQTMAQYFDRGTGHLFIRYISLLFAVALLTVTFVYIRKSLINKKYETIYDLVLHISILWIASSELINWLDITGSSDSYKLGLSILWGVYSLLLISIGIWKHRQYLRIGAIALFSVTLLKLFFYDISHLSTIAKTIVFVSLGILLLIISFLYNKYKHIIIDENEN